MADHVTVIPASRGVAVELREGQRFRVVNTHGTQVVDTWAFNRANLREFMSMEHCRAQLARYRPKAGDTLITNLRRPILTMVEDTSPGVHDTLLAACDRYRYELLGCKEYHRNCTDNLWEAMVGLLHHPVETPCPLNLFQNTPVEEGGVIGYHPTVSKPGQYVEFRAEMDAVICCSACPQDMIPINSNKPMDAELRVMGN